MADVYVAGIRCVTGICLADVGCPRAYVKLTGVAFSAGITRLAPVPCTYVFSAGVALQTSIIRADINAGAYIT